MSSRKRTRQSQSAKKKRASPRTRSTRKKSAPAIVEVSEEEDVASDVAKGRMFLLSIFIVRLPHCLF